MEPKELIGIEGTLPSFAAEQGPQVDWIKNDPNKYNWFSDGSEFLVALRVRNEKTGTTKWEFDTVQFDCDGDGASLRYLGGGEWYDKWTWDDFEYFALLEGEMPSTRPDED